MVTPGDAEPRPVTGGAHSGPRPRCQPRGAPRRQAWGCPQHPALCKQASWGPWLGLRTRPCLAPVVPGEGVWAEPPAAALWAQMVLILAASSAGKTDLSSARALFNLMFIYAAFA